jgi:hypothetical protein
MFIIYFINNIMCQNINLYFNLIYIYNKLWKIKNKKKEIEKELNCIIKD